MSKRVPLNCHSACVWAESTTNMWHDFTREKPNAGNCYKNFPKLPDSTTKKVWNMTTSNFFTTLNNCWIGQDTTVCWYVPKKRNAVVLVSPRYISGEEAMPKYVVLCIFYNMFDFTGFHGTLYTDKKTAAKFFCNVAMSVGKKGGPKLENAVWFIIFRCAICILFQTL